MAVIVGNLGHFDEKSEKFSDYADRFEAHVAANDIDDDKKVNVFLFFCGCYWSRRLQVVEEFVRSRQSEYKDVYTVDAAFAGALRTCSHCYC